MRYNGGKWRMAPWLVSLLPPHHAYVEPFAGGASVLMHKPRSAIEVYNDLDEGIVGVFRILRDPVLSEQLRRACELTPFSRAEFAACWEGAADPIENARRTIVRTQQGIGAKKRASRNGWRSRLTGGSPAQTWSGWPENVASWHQRLQGVAIECLSWHRILEIYDAPSTLFYCDPPYMLKTRAWDHRKIYEHEMTDSDHAELLGALRACTGSVVLSGYRSGLYDECLADWTRLDQHARAQGNHPRVECAWLNPRAAAATSQTLLALA
jgi:DNA adenine methylase